MKLTLDANCVINLFDQGSTTRTSVEELRGLVQLALDGRAEVSLTSRVEDDIATDRNEARRLELLEQLKIFPVIGTVGHWDTSKWGSDVFVDKPEQALVEEIQRILFPALAESDRRYKNKRNDIDHLAGHHINKRDIFVTDDGGILKRAETLKASIGIVVMTPADALAFVGRTDERRQRIEPVSVEGYSNSAMRGTVTFDYSNNDGKFVIGHGQTSFETRWSNASNTSIHAYRDGTAISAIAHVTANAPIDEITDATSYDFSSRVRTPRAGETVIWRNQAGFFAATRIVSVKARSHGAEQDELKFEYVIASSGSNSFAA